MGNDDRYSERETVKRRDDALKRMLATPHKPHKAPRKKKKKAKPSR
jgi:hypothetical protein